MFRESPSNFTVYAHRIHTVIGKTYNECLQAKTEMFELLYINEVEVKRLIYTDSRTVELFIYKGIHPML